MLSQHMRSQDGLQTYGSRHPPVGMGPRADGPQLLPITALPNVTYSACRAIKSSQLKYLPNGIYLPSPDYHWEGWTAGSVPDLQWGGWTCSPSTLGWKTALTWHVYGLVMIHTHIVTHANTTTPPPQLKIPFKPYSEFFLSSSVIKGLNS